MLLGDGVELGLVAILIVDEVGAEVNLLEGLVIAAFWEAKDLLVSRLVGIQDKHEGLSLAGHPDEGERVVPDTSVYFLVEQGDEHMIVCFDVLLGLIDYSHLKIVSVCQKL